MKLIIAEDVALLREGMASLLTDLGHEVLTTVGDADALRAAVPDHPEVDLVITDVRMPPHDADDGLRAAADLRRLHPELPVMILSAFVAGPYLRALLEGPGTAGVGYLLKERVGRVDDFIAALDVVRSGGVVIDPLVVASLMEVRRTYGGLGQLTPRETEVLERMARGESNTDIAKGLFLSMAAVNKHVTNIFTKLELPPGQDNRRVRAVLTWLEATRPVPLHDGRGGPGDRGPRT